MTGTATSANSKADVRVETKKSTNRRKSDEAADVSALPGAHFRCGRGADLQGPLTFSPKTLD
jgi:hypothetical protein